MEIDWKAMGYCAPYDSARPTFHAVDQLFFQRLADGNVRITKMPEIRLDHSRLEISGDVGWPGLRGGGVCVMPEFDMIIPFSSWCSIVAFSAARGETCETYANAQEFLKAQS